MFENIKPPTLNKEAGGQNPAGASAPAEQKPLEDIFASTDKPAKPEVFLPKAPAASPLPIGWENKNRGANYQKFLVAGGILAGAILFFLLSWYIYNRFPPGEDKTKTEETKTENLSEEKTSEQPAVIPEEEKTEEPLPLKETKDSDNDGLDDETEKNLGADPYSSDSDNDGLSDKEEVEVYSTNPINADTDADGYLDGQEVINGYNPKGAGKLPNF